MRGDQRLYRSVLDQLLTSLDKLIAVDEEEQLEKVRRSALESRRRFSLKHLVAGPEETAR